METYGPTLTGIANCFYNIYFLKTNAFPGLFGFLFHYTVSDDESLRITVHHGVGGHAHLQPQTLALGRQRQKDHCNRYY